VINGLDVQLLNPQMLHVLEIKAQQLSESFANLTGGLRSAMHATTAITLQHIQVHSQSVKEVCNSVKEDISVMESFTGRCEELNEQLRQMRSLYSEIKQLRKAVEHLDNLTLHASINKVL